MWQQGVPPACANNVVGGGGLSEKLGGASTSQARDSVSAGLASITLEQWHHLLDLINLPKPKDRLNVKSLWIIDTGATHHVTGMFLQLCATRKINGCPMSLSTWW